MLVWLASYPRSGNTLLRQVLKTCFDLDSCEGLELVPEQLRDPDGTRYRHYGTYYVDRDWEDFYRKSRESSELVLVKSHQLPRDDAKAIYVVRDGRLAVKSFVKFQDSYHPGESSFTSLLVGDHPYGEWTSHYRAWANRPAGPLLLLRFEELVNPSEETLARIGAFIGVGAPVRPWVSHLGELRQRHPGYFGSGEPAWRPDAFWGESRLRQFYTLHGELLAELGYATAAEAKSGALLAGSDGEQLLRSAHRVAAHRNALQSVCDERAGAMQRLAAEVERLAEACAGQAAEIDRLAEACAERLEEIGRLAEACEARARIINALDAARRTLERQAGEQDRRLREAQEELRPLRRYTLLGMLSRLAAR
jgi:hypothetical protein